MMSTFNPNMFQIVGDGEKLGIILPDKGMYTFDQYYSTELTFTQHSNLIREESMDGSIYYREGLPPLGEVQIGLRGYLNYIEDGSIQLFTKSILNKMTILELFRIINKKIEKRRN